MQDNGIGVAADDLPKLFAEFAQDQVSIPGCREGAGLGLGLVKWLAEAHCGRVWAESEDVPGKGATFYVALPG
jgi:signal transduction histidine kinase